MIHKYLAVSNLTDRKDLGGAVQNEKLTGRREQEIILDKKAGWLL